MNRSPKAPRKPRKTKDGLRNEAYELLGITHADVLAVPKIEPLLKRANVMEKLWHYLEQSSEPDARMLVAQRYKLRISSQRNSITFEAYCVAAKIETKRALGLVVSEVYSQTEQASLLMAAVAQPDIVAATIEAGKQASGSREREMLLKHSGFVPVPKTSITNVYGNRNVVGKQQNQTLAVLPPIEQTVKRISDRFNTMQPAEDTRLLESTSDCIEVEEIEDSGDDS